jgi:hypothetical protein
MAIYEHATEFAGKLVVDWDADTGIYKPNTIYDPAEAVYAIRLDYEEERAGQHWTDKFALFLDDPAVSQVTGIVVGNYPQWHERTPANSAPIVEALVAAQDRLPNLTAIFLGDIIMEESEISWINQSDVSPLFTAYPALEHFRVRGGNGLIVGSIRHERLKSLVIESGGLPVQVVRQVAAAELPALEHLELWLGDEGYGGDATIDNVSPLLFDNPFPNLHYLGLRDSEITDEIAFAIAKAPILERINVLDLSLGTLSDVGAAALLESPLIANLEKLDLHHHYCSAGVMRQLEELGQRLNIKIDVSDQQEPDMWDGEEHRFVAVSE